jgi:hypothetical protein
MRAPAWARGQQPDIVDDIETAGEQMRAEVARGRLHARGVGHLPLNRESARRELTEGQRALRSSRPRTRRWKALDRHDQEIDRLTRKQSEAQARLQQAEQALQHAPESDARTLADWLSAGEKGDRPAASVYERERERDAASLLVEAVDVELDRALKRREQHIERNRKTMFADVRKDMDVAGSRLLAQVAELPTLRQKLLDCREQIEWLAAYPEVPETFGFPSALALGLRAPVERTLRTTARVEYSGVLEALREDVAALAEAFSVAQKQGLGMPSERSPLKEAMWDADPANVKWKKAELQRARELLAWSSNPQELVQEAREFRPDPEDRG